MADKGFMKLDGLKELDRALADMGDKIGFKALRAGMMQASKPMFLSAKAGAQATGIKGFDAGATAAAMGRWTRKFTPTRTTLFIGPKNKNRKALALWNNQHGTDATRLNHFHLVEFGSVHGGAQPFLRPAFMANWRGFSKNFGRELRAAIEKVRRKHAR